MAMKIGVVGAGLMGAGIAQAAAEAGHDVRLVDVDDKIVSAGLGRVERSLDRAVKRGRRSEADSLAIGLRIRGSCALADLADRELVVEAVTERVEVKTDLFRELDRICSPGCVFASNTSSLSISEMGAASGRPDRFCGLHFFNPVPVMELVELIGAPATSEDTLRIARAFGESLGKTVIAAGDTPGFVVNRLLTPYLLDAIRALEAGVATREDIDAGMKLGCGHPMGPLALADFVGLDTLLHISGILFAAFGDPRYAAPPLLADMVQAGRLGRKSGRGFHEYD